MKKLILTVTMLWSALHADYTPEQLRSLNITYNKGVDLKEETGLSFEDTLCAIQLTESSGGRNIIGDQYINGRSVELFKSSLGPMQEQIRTVREIMEKNPEVMAEFGERYWYKTPHGEFDKYYNQYTKISDKVNYYTKIVNNPKWYKRTDKKGKDTMRWANAMLKKYQNKFKKYEGYVNKDQALINLLLTDVEASTYFAFYYLKMNYETAKRDGMSNPFFRSVSRYNGGWNNTPYYKRVMKNLKEVRRLKKLGLIKRTTYIDVPVLQDNFLAEELAPGMIGSTPLN